jgi:hypothetical protein
MFHRGAFAHADGDGDVDDEVFQDLSSIVRFDSLATALSSLHRRAAQQAQQITHLADMLAATTKSTSSSSSSSSSSSLSSSSPSTLSSRSSTPLSSSSLISSSSPLSSSAPPSSSSSSSDARVDAVLTELRALSARQSSLEGEVRKRHVFLSFSLFVLFVVLLLLTEQRAISARRSSF